MPVNWSSFCPNSQLSVLRDGQLVIWVPVLQDFGLCLHQLADIFGHIIFTVPAIQILVAAFHEKRRGRRPTETTRHGRFTVSAFHLRFLASAASFLTILVAGIIELITAPSDLLSPSFHLSYSVSGAAWFLVSAAALVTVLRRNHVFGDWTSSSTQLWSFVFWFPLCAVSVWQVWSAVGGVFAAAFLQVLTVRSYTFAACQLLYAFSLVWSLLQLQPSNSHRTEPNFETVRDSYNASRWISKMLFRWVAPLIKVGRHLLTADQLFRLPQSWNYRIKAEIFRERITQCDKSSKLWLVREWFSVWGLPWSVAGLLFLCSLLAEYASPFFLERLVSFFETGDRSANDGVYWAGAFLGCQLLSMFLHVHYHFFDARIALTSKAALMDTIYKKLLSVPNSDIHSADMSGKVVNLIGTDCEQIGTGLVELHHVWGMPFEVIFALYLLYLQVGLSFLAGVAVVVVLLIVNQVVASWLVKYQEKRQGCADARIKLVQELLSCIRVVKFHAWEAFFQGRLSAARERELRYLKVENLFNALEAVVWGFVPIGLALATFALYIGLGNSLTAAKVFTSIAVIRLMNYPLLMVSWEIVSLIETWVSVKRVSAYLSMPVLHPVTATADAETSIVNIKSASFSCQSSSDLHGSSSPQLRDITLRISEGEFIGVVGRIGSGKSLLLHSIMGELHLTNGQVAINGLVNEEGFGYVAQDAHIIHGTIRSNVLFGDVAYDPDWYGQVLQACALTEDVREFQYGDLTEIGEGGITLSGGQKARLSLARAVYQRKKLYLLDDPLASVDAKVARHIYRHCLRGLLRGRIVVLVSHNVEFLREADRILAIEHGGIIAEGSPADILSLSLIADSRFDANPSREPGAHERTPGTVPLDSVEKELENDEEESGMDVPLIREEEKESGEVKAGVHLAYVSALGWFTVGAIFFFLVLSQGGVNTSDVWLSYWISQETVIVGGLRDYYFQVFGYISLATVLTSVVWPILIFWAATRASRLFHSRLLNAIVKAQIQFFDTTPSGRIVNRFSSDMSAIDENLALMFLIFIAELCGTAGLFVVIVYSQPLIAAVILPVSILYYVVQKRYRYTTRELKRLNALTLSPMYSQYSETIQGLTTVRALRCQAFFAEKFAGLIELHLRVQFAFAGAEQWLELAFGLLGAAIALAILVIGFSLKSSAASFGLALSYSMTILTALLSMVESFISYEKSVISVERVLQYVNGIAPEKYEGTLQAPPEWPSHGKVEMHQVSIRYRDDLPNVLKDVDLKVEGGQKVGIVGRTGAGKSTILMALFRMVEPSSGSISIDDIPINQLALVDLRRKLTIIPQSPAVFDASIRDNLDPLCVHQDEEIWKAVRSCHLQSVVDKLGAGLLGAVGHNGRNLSAGERQLVSLARAVLNRTRIVCFDEATASVDFDTDQLIQKTINEQLSECTILTIAHRMQTVMECDRVVVISDGQLVEEGSPRQLLRDPHSRFTQFNSHFSSLDMG